MGYIFWHNLDCSASTPKMVLRFDSLLMTDSTKGNITYCNNAFTKLTGYSQEDILGKSPKLLQGAATDQKTIDRLREALKTGGEYEGRAINYKKDGTPFIMY